jgi:4-amino-4-deoxy-L-arabinose transferase-like glycosyltransferase
LACIYFLLFIPPNLIGTKDPAMLAAFNLDEFAQFPHLLRMLTPADTPYQTLRNFTVYLHYFYGYPFYFFSAIAVLPLRLLAGMGEQQTQSFLLILRQCISILPMLLAVYFITEMQIGKKHFVRFIALALFLLCIPLVFKNNLWWHPDSLSFLFAALTLYCLYKDDLRLGKQFLWAAVFCGLAIGTKQLGWFFFLTVPVYLLFAFLRKKVSAGQVLLKALLFLALMLLIIIVSNPLLLLPIERQEIIAVQRKQLAASFQGFAIKNPETVASFGHYPQNLTISFGYWPILVFALLGHVLSLTRPRTRLRGLLFLSWLIPLSLSLNFSGTRSLHYFLPVLIPLMAGLASFFDPQIFPIMKRKSAFPSILRKIFTALLMVLITAQFVIFLFQNVRVYSSYLQREQQSHSLAFFNVLWHDYLQDLQSSTAVHVLHEPQVYFPQREGFSVHMSWEPANFSYLNEINPHLLLLDKNTTATYTEEGLLEQAVDPQRMFAFIEFYQAVEEESLENYVLFFEDDYGIAFARQDFYDWYLKEE